MRYRARKQVIKSRSHGVSEELGILLHGGKITWAERWQFDEAQRTFKLNDSKKTYKRYPINGQMSYQYTIALSYSGIYCSLFNKDIYFSVL